MLNIAISIPVYNQPHYLKELLGSLQVQQSFNGHIYVYDDCSTKNYLPVIQQFNSLCILYSRNQENFGAMANMQHSFNETVKSYSSDYVMILHEDDLLDPGFFTTIHLACTTSQKKPALVLSCFTEFIDSKEIVYDQKIEASGNYRWIKKVELVEMFLKNRSIAFGSAIYNVLNYNELYFDFNQYGEFSDRPMLLNGLGDDDDVLLLTNSLYYARSHGSNDTRWRQLKPEHIFSLLDFYKDILSNHIRNNKLDFKKFSTGFSIESYQNLRYSGHAPSWFFYILSGFWEGHLSLKYLLLKNSLINRFFTWFFNKN
jgi:glycosyltransferase involved in cell wall biosynthesis